MQELNSITWVNHLWQCKVRAGIKPGESRQSRVHAGPAQEAQLWIAPVFGTFVGNHSDLENDCIMIAKGVQ